MTDTEKQVMIDTAKDLEKDMLAFCDAEMDKLPEGYKALAMAFWEPAKIAMKSFINAKIAAM